MTNKDDPPQNQPVQQAKPRKRLDGEIYIEVLKSQPGKPILAAALYGWDQTSPYKYIDDNPKVFYIPELDAFSEDPQVAIPKTDSQTLTEVKKCLDSLKGQIQEAVENNDYSKADDLRDEEEHYLKYLNETSTPSGKVKNYPGQNDKALKKIKLAINYYLKSLEATNPEKAQYIRERLKLGKTCMWSDS